VVVGEPAKREAAQHPRRTIASAKRLMGRSMADAAGDLPMLSYKVVEGPGRTARIELPAGDGAARVVSPQEVSAHVLAALKRRAEALLSAEVGRRVEVRKAVVTVPAYFDDAQRQATRDAARLAGLEAVRLVAEPTAAALAYGLGVRAASTLTRPDEAGGVPSGPGPTVTGADAGKLVVVYDLGGGTFDVSVLRIAPAGLGAEAFMVLATAGDTRLGGDDMDHAVVRWCAERLDALAPGSGTALLEDPGARRELLAGAERAKVLLSTSDSAIIEPPGGLPTLTLTRGDFEKLIEPLVERTLAACRRAVRDAQRAGAGLSLGPGAADNSGADRQAPAAVILVGGATRVPLVRARVARFFGVTPYTAIDPDCAVALGAAVQAGVLSGAEAGALLLDVIPLSLGIETAGGAMAKIVMRNSPVPAEAHEMFSTGVDGQTSVKLNILQGEREMAADCRSLGEFHLRGVPAMPAGIPQLRVTFRVDANAILSVSAVELRTGVRLDVQVVPNHGLTREEVERIELESFASAREDMRRHRVADLVANSTLDLGWIQRQLARHALALAPAQREAIELAAARLRGFVQEAGGPAGGGPDPDAFHAAKEALDRASIPLHEAAITSTLRASNQ
jgi:molecular chaperone DnaK (HSP70)